MERKVVSEQVPESQGTYRWFTDHHDKTLAVKMALKCNTNKHILLQCFLPFERQILLIHLLKIFQFAEVFFYTLLTIYHLMTSFDAPEEENILKTYWEKEKMLLIIND